MAGLGPDGNRGDGAGLDRSHIRRGGQIDADADRDRQHRSADPPLSSRIPATLPPFSSTSLGHLIASRA